MLAIGGAGGDMPLAPPLCPCRAFGSACDSADLNQRQLNSRIAHGWAATAQTDKVDFGDVQWVGGPTGALVFRRCPRELSKGTIQC
jgi:hypothetical protein